MSSNSDISKNKSIAIFSYFIFFLPYLTAAKDSKFAIFHANQSLVLVIIAVASGIISGAVPILGSLISMVVSLGVLVLWIMGIISAANGETKPLPVIGTIKLLNN